jgi:hypothetical protein
VWGTWLGYKETKKESAVTTNVKEREKRGRE